MAAAKCTVIDWREESFKGVKVTKGKQWGNLKEALWKLH